MPTLICNIQSSRVKSVAFHPRRPWVMIACHDGFVELHDYVVGALVDRFLAHSAPVRACAFHASQALFATGSDDRTVKLWDLETRKEIATLTGHSDYIRYVDFHASRPYLSSASDDCTVKIWNFESRQCVASLAGHKEFIMCCRFHPTEDLIATAALDATMRIWDLSQVNKQAGSKKGVIEKTLQKVLQLPSCTISMSVNGEAHTRGVNWVCWGENDSLYSSSDDYSVREWRLLRGKPEAGEILGLDATLYSHATMTGHSGNVNAVEVGRDNVILSASSDGTVRIYEQKTRTFVGSISAADYGVQAVEQPCRFWCLAQHPKQSIWAAGHDEGLLIFDVLDNQDVASFVQDKTVFWCKDNQLVAAKSQASDLQYLNKLQIQVAKQGSFGAGKRVLKPVRLLPVGEPFPVIFEFSDGVSRYGITLISKGSEGSAEFPIESNIIKISETQVLYFLNNELVIGIPSKDGVVIQKEVKFTRIVKYLTQGYNANEFIAFYEKGEADVCRFLGDKVEIVEKLQFEYSIIDSVRSAKCNLIGLRSNRSCVILNEAYEIVSQTEISSNISSFAFASLGRGFENTNDNTLIFTTATHVCYLCCGNNVSGVITSLNKELRVQYATGQQMIFLDDSLELINIEFDSRLCGLMAAISDDRKGDAAILVKRIKRNNFGNALTGRLINAGYYKEALALISDDNKQLKQKLAIEMGSLPNEVEKEFESSFVQKAMEMQQWKKAFKYADCDEQAMINLINNSSEPVRYEKNGDMQHQLSAAMIMQDNDQMVKILTKLGFEAVAGVFANSRNMETEIDMTQYEFAEMGKNIERVERPNELTNWPMEEQEELELDTIVDSGEETHNEPLWEEKNDQLEAPQVEVSSSVNNNNDKPADNNWSSTESSENNAPSDLPDILNSRSQAFKESGLCAECEAVKDMFEKIKQNNNQLPFDHKSTDKLFKQAIKSTDGQFEDAIDAFRQAYLEYKFLQVETGKLSEDANTCIEYIRGLTAEVQRQKVEEPKQMATLALIFAKEEMLPQHKVRALATAMTKLKKNNFGAMSKMCATEILSVIDLLPENEDKYREKAEKHLECKGGEKLVQNFDFCVNYSTMKIEKCEEVCECCDSPGDDDESCIICQCGWIE